MPGPAGPPGIRVACAQGAPVPVAEGGGMADIPEVEEAAAAAAVAAAAVG